jgi:type IV secretion system protein VirB9
MRKQWIVAMAIALPCVLASVVVGSTAQAQPVITDSRVKTLVYNANDVYSLLTHHGYQASIEFGEKETVQTISVGDRVSWQIIPDGRRLYLRSLVGGASTNMSVVTNLHTYQFDLRATKGGSVPVREDLVYLVRFYYPDERIAKTAEGALAPVYADELVGAAVQPEPQLPALNFSYSYTGEATHAPSRTFDDGSATYFKLTKPAKIFVVNGAKQEVPVMVTRTSDGFLKAPMVSPRFVIRYEDGNYICVYNERMNAPAVPMAAADGVGGM